MPNILCYCSRSLHRGWLRNDGMLCDSADTGHTFQHERRIVRLFLDSVLDTKETPHQTTEFQLHACSMRYILSPLGCVFPTLEKAQIALIGADAMAGRCGCRPRLNVEHTRVIDPAFAKYKCRWIGDVLPSKFVCVATIDGEICGHVRLRGEQEFDFVDDVSRAGHFFDSSYLITVFTRLVTSSDYAGMNLSLTVHGFCDVNTVEVNGYTHRAQDREDALNVRHFVESVLDRYTASYDSPEVHNKQQKLGPIVTLSRECPNG